MSPALWEGAERRDSPCRRVEQVLTLCAPQGHISSQLNHSWLGVEPPGPCAHTPHSVGVPAELGCSQWEPHCVCAASGVAANIPALAITSVAVRAQDSVIPAERAAAPATCTQLAPNSAPWGR